jgi:hypothetical protein
MFVIAIQEQHLIIVVLHLEVAEGLALYKCTIDFTLARA